MTNTNSRTRRISVTIATALALGASLAGCSAIEQIQKSAADAWAVTYEVTVEGQSTATLTNVSFLDQATRAEERTTVSADSVTATAGENGVATWSANSIVIVGDKAKLEATAADGERATCKILLDGKRAIANETGEPGGTVTCAATAPAFDN